MAGRGECRKGPRATWIVTWGAEDGTKGAVGKSLGKTAVPLHSVLRSRSRAADLSVAFRLQFFGMLMSGNSPRIKRYRYGISRDQGCSSQKMACGTRHMICPWLLASTALSGWMLASPVLAETPPSWTGFYFGGNVGPAWGKSKTSCSFIPGIGTPCEGITMPNNTPRGSAFGVEVGANWQYQALVFGLSSDMSWLDMHVNNAAQFPAIDAGKTDQLSAGYDWLGTVRGRVGIAVGQSLFYGTGGAAFGRVRHEYDNNLVSPDTTPQTFSTSSTKTGWAAGFGWEYMIFRNWTFKLEYLHADLGSSNLDISASRTFGAAAGSPPGSAVLHFDDQIDLVRAGFNLKF